MSDQQRGSHWMTGYECIDPDLGDQLWRRDDPATAPALVARLDAHLAHCAACRLQEAVTRDVAAGLRAGWLERAPAPRGRRRLSGTLAVGGLAALAASILLVFVVPPRSPAASRIERGAPTAGGLVRPVPDEKILSATPVLRWQPVAGVSHYQVVVRGVANDYELHRSVTEPWLAVPTEHPLPADSRYRIAVSTVPKDLSPRGGWRGSFARVSAARFVGYRIGAASPWVLLPGLAGLVLLSTALFATLRTRRT